MPARTTPAGFDPERATRQNFVDGVINAIQSREGSFGAGWHLVEMTTSTLGESVLIFECPTPLRGWQPGSDEPYWGPHRVRVAVTSVGAAEESGAL